jgi:hypothetical protein
MLVGLMLVGLMLVGLPQLSEQSLLKKLKKKTAAAVWLVCGV